MKKYLFLSLFIILTACGKPSVAEQQPDNSKTYSMEELPSDSEMTSELITNETESNAIFEGLPDKEAADYELQNKNYYNKDLIYLNGFYYCLHSDGLYTKKEKDTEWELIYETPTTLQKGIRNFGSYLYFLTPASIEDGNEINVPKTLCRFNLDTLEAENIMTLDKKVVDFTIYNDAIYFMVQGNLATAHYEAYGLNEQGMIGEQLTEISPDFICQDANEYHILADNNDPNVKELKEEVLPTPHSAVMLNGYVLLSGHLNEAENNFFLKSCKDNTEAFLFSATAVFLVTSDGIYYWPEGGFSLEYYSFETGKSTPFVSFEESIDLYPLTYDADWLYVYNIFEPEISRISRNTGTIESLKEYEMQDFWNCFVCEGYLYVDGQIINAS